MNICIYAFIHSTVWRTCDVSGTVVYKDTKIKEKAGRWWLGHSMANVCQMEKPTRIKVKG